MIENHAMASENQENENAIKVYARDGKYGTMYSGTDSKGNLVNFKFDGDLQVPNLKAFEILNAVGTEKSKEIETEQGTVNARILYITSCDFRKIVGDKLPL